MSAIHTQVERTNNTIRKSYIRFWTPLKISELIIIRCVFFI
jgi:hypothetical protein